MKEHNSGVFINSKTSCVARSVDKNLRQAELSYYGKLEDIIEINYNGMFKVVLFKCKWADTTRDRGYQKDSWKFIFVNFDRSIHVGEFKNMSLTPKHLKHKQCTMDDIVNKWLSVVVHLNQ